MYFRILLPLLFLVVGRISCTNERIFELSEICEVPTGVRIYVDFGYSGVVKSTGDEGRVYANPCFFTLVTCSSCSIQLKWKLEDGAKGEENFTIAEPPYSNVEVKSLADPSTGYVTKTRALSLQFPPESINMNFSLFYESQRNIVTVSEPLLLGNGFAETTKQIATPFFPAMYTRDFIVDYNISCLTDDCRIRIIFTDFQLAIISTIELFDANQERFNIFSGAFFRPPVIFSPTSTLRIRFSANGGTDLGFRANVTFFPASEATNILLNPSTDCGGSVSSLGGAIAMMNMASGDEEVFYDCIWIVRPSHRYFHLQDQLLLRVQSFSKMGEASELNVHRGVTSMHPLLLRIVRPQANYSDGIGQNLIVPLSSGFYVHFRGYFRASSQLVVVYAAFGIRDCYIGTGFMCKNRRCIAIELRCDGFDQCGDSSDEPSSCLAENGSIWHTHPNYFFPKADTFDDENFRTVSIVLIFCSFGTAILLIFFLLYRVNMRRARHQENLQSHLQTISDLLDHNAAPNEDVPADEPPPNYEAPPEYEDVIKVGREYELRKTRRSRRHSTKRRRSDAHKIPSEGSSVTPLSLMDAEEEVISIVTNSEETSEVILASSLGERFDSIGKIRVALEKTPETYQEAQEAEGTKDRGSTVLLESQFGDFE
ncbi:uncharacterized protein LOC129792267 isoform X2 [Lutzomyia longipalpis]|uniref:uncharacterized protein LOC129792267 isoform X2 n=1 Tax=Lutzomyia longipalpis TaxID=7200 RepID=UPI0024833CD1|nr:uncharacterized protein LOC129792267 isoform X2 [Lutzomyia longipalpis]